jgi:cell division transport system permease protein
MRAWLRHHRHALGGALGKLAAQKPAAALNALAIGVALALPALGYALLASLQSAAQGLALEPQLSLYLKAETGRAEGEALAARLRADPRVREARFVPREQALRELDASDALRDAVAAIGRNPLPDAIVLQPRAPGADALGALARELRASAAAAHVQLDSAWTRRLDALTRTARIAVALLAGLLAVATVAVTYNTIRLQVLTQRAEIEVSRLIGATDAFIRRPFYYLGLLEGLAGGVLALAIVWAALAALNLGVAELAETYGSRYRLSFLQPGDALAIVGFSGLLGWMGAYLSVSKYLRELESDLAL